MAVASLSADRTVPVDSRLTDSHGRVIHDLRVSITDRCNYKCVYCRTGEAGSAVSRAGHRRVPAAHRALRRPRHHQGAAHRRRAAAAPRPGRPGRGTRRAAHPRRRAARPGAHHQRPSAGLARRAAQGRRPEPRHGQHGRRGRADLRAHHARPGQLSGGPRRHSRRARRRPHAAQDQLRAAARLQRRPDRGLCPLCARRERRRPVHRVHAARRRPPVDAGDRGAAQGDRRPHRPRRMPAASSCLRARPAKRRGATPSRTAWARSASSRR